VSTLLRSNSRQRGTCNDVSGFDLALSEYGASIWCDPYLWIPEAARLLRPGAELVFLVNSTIFMLFAPHEDGVAAGTELVRDYFGMHRFDWPEGSVEFHLPYGEWIRLLRASGFEVEALAELQAPEDALDKNAPPVTAAWARRWPSEEIWKARKRG
jgi:SAM-dependent methyltransferase